MSLEDLKKKFIVDDDVLKVRIEPLVEKALNHCQIHKNGTVLITSTKLSAKDKVQLALVARLLASQLETSIVAEMTVAEIEKSTGLPANQVSARSGDLVKEKVTESPKKGIYRATAHKVEDFLDRLGKGKKV